MFTSIVLADLLILIGIPFLVGALLIYFADILRRRRDDEFLGALNEIINKKDYQEKTDKKSDE